MVKIQFTLSRKSDADLISFFAGQNEKAAALTAAALFSYIQGIPLYLPLLPVTVTEQTKRMNIYVAIRENNRKQADVRGLKRFLDSIPAGMKSVYIKGILRYTYGSVIYQTEAATPRRAQNTEGYVSPDCLMPEGSPETDDGNPDAMSRRITPDAGNPPDSDIFGLFESLLG